MNWKKIWIGGLLAAAVALALDTAMVAVLTKSYGDGPMPWVVILYLFPPSLLTGFVVSWLYALVRPRLGPGPRTAIIIGTAAFALYQGAMVLNMMGWMQAPKMMVIQSVLAWVKCVAATYVAGWHYVEKSPV